MKHAGITGMMVVFLFVSSPLAAQQSLMKEISIPFLEKLIETTKANYPRVKAFNKKIDIARNNLNKVSLSWFDGLGVYYLYLPPNTAGNIANPTTNRNGFQLGFSLNVGSLLEKPAQINAAKGEREVAKLEKQEYDLSIEASVKERYYKYVQQLTLLKQRLQLLLDAQTMLASVRTRFEKGQETFENYNRSLSFYNQQNQEQINTEAEMLISKARLEELIGKKLEEVVLEEEKK